MLRCLLVTCAVLSVTCAVKCYSGCVAGTMTMAGQEQDYPGGACTGATVANCDGGCATAYLAFDYEMEVGETKMEGSADATTAMCSMGSANDNLCDTMKSSLESTMGAVSNLKCKISTCDTWKCNDPAKSGGNAESDGGENEGEDEGEAEGDAESEGEGKDEGKDEDDAESEGEGDGEAEGESEGESSFIVHGVSFVLFSAILGLLC